MAEDIARIEPDDMPSNDNDEGESNSVERQSLISSGTDPQNSSGKSQYASVRSLSPFTVINQSRASTKSLSGSAFEQQIENGRRYANDNYFMPNDEAENTRLAIAHQTFLLLLGGQLTLARVRSHVRRILDVGTGGGDWAIAMGERCPNAEIIATDISAHQPTSVPPNVVFQIDDAQDGWTFTEPFDLIYMRGMAGAFSDWPLIYAEAFQHLKQGGVLELADFGAIRLEQQSSDSYLSIYSGACQSAAERAGIAIGLAHLKKEVLERAGFSVVKSMILDVPLGSWTPDPQKKIVGKMALISVLEALEATSLRLLTRELNWKAEDVRDLCGKVQAEITSPGARASVQCQFVLARRLLIPA